MVGDSAQPVDTAALQTCRIVFLGAAKSGKSSLVSQFAYHSFYEEYEPTSLDTVCSNTVVDGIAYTIKLTDCCADAEFAEQRETYLRNADVVVLVYSITDKNSLAFLQTAVEQARDAQMYTRKGFFPVFVVGTHADVEPSQRRVTRQEGEDVAEEICFAHADLIRPLFLRANKSVSAPDPVAHKQLGTVTTKMWMPSAPSLQSLSPHTSPLSASLAQFASSPSSSATSVLLPAGASSVVPFMELSARDGAAVSTFFDALVRLHVIASSFHDRHMPVKRTPVTSPVTIAAATAAAAAAAGGGGGVGGNHSASQEYVDGASAPVPVRSSSGKPCTLHSRKHPQHLRTFSTASTGSAQNAGTEAAVVEMGAALNCLPSPVYLYGVPSGSLGGSAESSLRGGSFSVGGGVGGSGSYPGKTATTHRDPAKLPAGALYPRTPHSSSFVSMCSQPSVGEDPLPVAPLETPKRPSRLQQTPSGPAVQPSREAHTAHSGDRPPSPESPTLVESTKIPIARVTQKDAAGHPAVSSVPDKPASAPDAPSVVEPKALHSRAESGQSRQSNGAAAASAKTGKHAPSNSKKSKSNKNGHNKDCVVM